MAQIKQAKLDELIPDDHNFNIGTEFGQHLMEKSFRQFGAGRSILLDKNNRVIAGNKSLQTAAEIGMDDVVIVETTGNQIVAVKRTDVDLDSKQGREMALADNATSKANLDFDLPEIEEITAQLDINAQDWGVKFEEIGDYNPDEFGEEFSLPSGDKSPFKQWTFTLSNEQYFKLEELIKEAQKLEEFKYVETFGNDNKNGNALYLIISQWAEQKK